MTSQFLSFVMVVIAPNVMNATEESMAIRPFSKIGFAYHAFHAKHDRSPGGVDEFADYLSKSRTARQYSKLIRDKEIIMVWNAMFSDDGCANDTFVLGYHKDVPNRGGFVIMGGGFVEKVTADAFKKLQLIAAKKAKEKNV